MTILGLDLGTGSTKALVVADDGVVLGHRSAGHAVDSPVAGAAQSDPNAWLASVATAAAQALGEAGQPGIDAIGLSGQMHGAVCADSNGRPLRPALLWPDTRATDGAARLRALGPVDRAALGNPVAPGMFGPLLAMARQESARVRQQLAWALSPKDWLRWQLTGAVHTEPSDASATLLWDLRRSCWSGAALDALAIPAHVLPPLVASTQVVGGLQASSAAVLGLPSGTPVVAGAADTAAAILGSGLEQGQAQLSIGTGAQLVVPIAAVAAQPDPVVHCYRSATATGWYAMAAVQNAGLALEWVRGLFDAEWDEMHAALDHVPPGAHGVTFHPYLTGERTPLLDTHVRAAWQGIGPHVRRPTLLRACLEGVAFALRDALEALVASGVTVDGLRLVGGGTGDPRWRTLLSTALGQRLTPLALADASAYGACRLAAAATGTTLTPTGHLGPAIAPDEAAADPIEAAWQHWRRRRPTG